MQEVASRNVTKASPMRLCVFMIGSAPVGPAAGQSASKAPPQVQHELASMMKDCRDVGGKLAKSPGALAVAKMAKMGSE